MFYWLKIFLCFCKTSCLLIELNRSLQHKKLFSEFSKLLAENEKEEILKLDNTLQVRYNYPYLGKADGFTTYLRKQDYKNYIGIELEINQKHSKNNVINKT
ncbi:hypothetical protein KO494_02870 [Lacinutrix sp. C3R15]|uniref:hypothetical protein n=1 Tax=Flavobacteriaceae TaxID=49546 RepID=UPI001C07FFA2|nr:MULTISPECIES: hypothetical protein [Flavobacteriaceae]MBU2938472.1 hypothetical protein [Lacinutrix sp. C3R15]MDO6621786.1 hypothetical protein [Oceanihabitans sp. 1_MG-2023]